MQESSYLAALSVDEAIRVLDGRGGPETHLLAGGTDLLIQIRAAGPRPRCILDLKRIPETRQLIPGAAGLTIGAAVTAAELREREGVRERWPGLVEAAELIGSEQIQGRATLGGNLCNASPAADTIPPLIALGARCRIAGPRGERTLPVESFVTGPGENALEHGELLVEVQVPAPAPGGADAYLRLTPRSEMDIAMVGAAVSLTLDAAGACSAARVALGAVAPTAIAVPEAAAALVGGPVDSSALERLAEAARAAARPIDDMRATASYRRQVTGVLVQRAARIAAERAIARREG
ncbi:MAG: FAD binding domain-containing protein [Myxococcota bacterium]